MNNQDNGYEIQIKKREIIQESQHNISSCSNMPLSALISEAETYLNCIHEEKDTGYRVLLDELIDKILSATTLSGNANDFHNLAVQLARKDEYLLACKVLECGLTHYMREADLLADYLTYGVSAIEKNENEDIIKNNCQNYFQVLNSIPRVLWTWRAYSFMIDYMLYRCNQECSSNEEAEAKKQEMLMLAREYRMAFPYDEDGYISESDIYRRFHEPENELCILEEGIKKIKVCPKCALRCGDIYVDRGEYQKAMVKIKRCVQDANQTQSNINEGYMYYIFALCKIAVLQKKKQDYVYDAKTIQDIYSDFNIALKRFGDNHSDYRSVIKEKTIALRDKSGIQIQDNCEKLYELIA